MLSIHLQKLPIMHLTALVGAPAERIPAQVDWRSTGADGPVKVLPATSSCSPRCLLLMVHRYGECKILTECIVINNRISLRAARVGHLGPSAQRRLHTSWPQVQPSASCPK